MAQRRMISKRITQSDKLSIDLRDNNLARFVYVALLPYTDKEGRVNANPYGLAGTIFEAFEYTIEEIAVALQALSDVGLFKLYQTKTHKLIAQYVKFTDFNTPHQKESDSDFPGPGTTGTTTITDVAEATGMHLPEAFPESSGKTPRRKEWSEKGTESTVDPVRGPHAGAREDGPAPDGGGPSQDDDPELAARLANLPEGCHAYVRMTHGRQKSEAAKKLEAWTMQLKAGEA